MKLRLPSGMEINLWVKHGVYPIEIKGSWDSVCGQKTELRGTQVDLKLEDRGSVYQNVVHSYCRPPDQFCKRTGRRLAATKLLKSVRNYFPFEKKEDRKAIFLAICPEFGETDAVFLKSDKKKKVKDIND